MPSIHHLLRRVLTLLVLSTSVVLPLRGGEPPADLASPPADAQKTASGLIWKELAKGDGTVRPAEGDIVKVRYTVWTTDGRELASVAEPRVAILPVTGMIPGWREGIQSMVTGERRRLWLDEALADNGKGGQPKPLVIDTELVEIIPLPPTPDDVAAPPADAERTDSGLASKVLSTGTGTVHPKASSRVTVHYSGWTTDGRMFDSSVARGEPITFSLRQVIAGWREGLQMMVVGEKRRLWIPGKLAYDGKPDKPQGMLVFDVELLDIQ